MEFLPDEITVHILSFIHPIYGELLELRTVCQKWRTIIDTTGTLWKHIHLDDDRSVEDENYNKNTTALMICLQRYGHFIQCIRAEDQAFFANTKLRHLLVPLTGLRKLDIPVLTWTRYFANSLKSAPSLKYLTIDECNNGELQTTEEGSARRKRPVLRPWSMRSLSRVFPNLDVLSLNTSLRKLCRIDIVHILDNLNLKELHLEINPQELNEMEQVQSLGVHPVRNIISSKHSGILTSLEIRCIPVTVGDIVGFTKGLQNLQHLIIGSVSSMGQDSTMTSLNLESQSLKVMLLSSMPSAWIRTVRCEMRNLEVLMVAECYDITSLEVRSACLLSLALRDDISLESIKTHGQSLNDFELRNCGAFGFESFKSFLRENLELTRIELEVEWESIVLDHRDCAQLRKLLIWEADLVLCRLQVSCPSLKVFKCTGAMGPRKGRRNFQFQGCVLEINALHLKKIKIQDVLHASEIKINCTSINDVQVIGKTCVLRPLDLDLVATETIQNICLTDIRLKQVSVNCPTVGDVMLNDCCLATGNTKCRMRFKCDRVQALRVIKCEGIRRFALKVPYVGHLTLASCKKLRDLDLGMTSVGHVRVVDCPLLAPMTNMTRGDPR